MSVQELMREANMELRRDTGSQSKLIDQAVIRADLDRGIDVIKPEH